jgi:putative ABC transport system permease protein
VATNEIRVALFYSKKHILKNKNIFIFITLAIIFATASIILINGIVDGMIYGQVDNAVESSLGHLNIYPDEDDRFIEGLGIKEQRLDELKDVEAYSSRISASGVLSNKELSSPVGILGLDPAKETHVSKLLTKIISGTTLDPNDKDAILISSRLAEDLKINAGDKATVTFETGNVREYQVKGIVRTGNMDFDGSSIIMQMNEVNRQLGIDNRASVILIKLSGKDMANSYKPILMQNLQVNNVKTWEDEVEFILRFSQGMRGFSVIISLVGLIAAGVSVGILIYINMIHKKRQIGIMKALGARDPFIFKIFIIEAMLFGVIGVSLGDGLGYLAIKYFQANPFYDAVQQSWISARFSYNTLYSATIVCFSVTILSGVYPAIKASRVNIIRAIWGE